MKRGSGLCRVCSQKQGTAKHEKMMLNESKAVSDVPELMVDWDSNNLLDPTKVSYGSNKTAFWICRQCKRSFPRMISNQYHSLTHFCEDCAAKFRHEEHRKSMAKYSETIADRPNMIALWDWDNNTRSPHDLSAKSGILVNWKCKCGNTWEEKPCYRYNLLPHCMKCSMRIHNDRKNKRAIEKGGTWGENHPKLAKQWHPTLNGNVSPYDITPNCCTPYYFLCEYGHAYKAEPRERALNHAGCPICNAGRRTSFAEQAISFYLGKIIEVKSNYPIMSHSELDVFIPKLSISNNQAAIEFDGSYWHSQKRSIDRDAKKDQYCKDNGIRLIRVKEAQYNKKIDSNLILFDRKSNDYQWLINELCSELGLPVVDVDIIKDTPEILERLNIVDVETSLAKKRPDALAYWNYEENAPMKPEKVGYTSSHIFTWHCPKCGNDFLDSVSAVSHRKYICKKCGENLRGINISKAKRKTNK